MELSGWGRYPRAEAQLCQPLHPQQALAGLQEGETDCIARGLGRSYGDAALAGCVIDTCRLDNFISFDGDSGELHCQAGVSLAQLLQHFLPLGWLPPVLPGTRFVSVGGAIASDVHGKNHHCDGSFSDWVEDLHIATVSDGIVRCSREEHAELFHGTCGGMGLTGVIVSATLRLRRVASGYIDETVHLAPDLDSALALFRRHAAASYSVAWIDCAASGADLGRSVVRLGEHSPGGRLAVPEGRRLAVPCELPGGLLNRHTVRAFNHCYYRAAQRGEQQRRVPLLSWFFPLDRVGQWNRVYGPRGFLQYQCVLPLAAVDGLRELLDRIAQSGHGSFLAVLKVFGEGNDNPLSFPQAGYTLALDFARRPGLEALLQALDEVVLRHTGRLYLAKDARMPVEVFRAGYPRWGEFRDLRRTWGAERAFNSLLSRRLGI